MDEAEAFESGFRCCSCGLTRSITGVKEGVLTISKTEGATEPKCERCGRILWAKMFTHAEHYDFWRRPDVCRVGGHVAEGIEEFELQPTAAPQPGGSLQVSALFVKSCPDCVDALDDFHPGYRRKAD